jgi:hypothetical protein
VIYAALGSMSGTTMGAVLSLAVAALAVAAVFAAGWWSKRQGATIDRIDDLAQADLDAPYSAAPPAPDHKPDEDTPSDWAHDRLAAIRLAAAQETATIRAAAAEPKPTPFPDWMSPALRESARQAEAALHTGMTGAFTRMTDEELDRIAREFAAAAAS